MDTRLEDVGFAPKASDAGRVELERCRRELDECRRRIDQMEGVFTHVADAIFVAEPDGRIMDVNPAACATLEYSREELLAMRPWDFIGEAWREQTLDLVRNMKCGLPVAIERIYRSKNGREKVMEVRITRCNLGGRDLVIVSCRDATHRRWAETLLAGEKKLLEMVARGDSLPLILDAVCRVVEEVSIGSICSILLMDTKGERLLHGAAPSLPKGYIQAIDGREIAPCAGPCAKAAVHRKPVIVSDVAALSSGAEYRDLALAFGLRACWSTPILSTENNVLGTFAIYSRQPGSPTAQQYQVIEQITHLTAVAVERQRAEEALRRNEAYLAEAQGLSRTGSFGWNVATGEIVWSRETYCIMGVERTIKPTLELVFNRVHPEDLPRVRQMVDRVRGDGTDLDFEHRLLMPDGAVKHVHVVARATKDELQRLEFIGALMDITGQEKIEEALRVSEQLARGQLEALTSTLDALARETAPDRLVEHVLCTITEQLGAHSSSVWQREEASGEIEFQFAFEGGKFVTKSDSSLAGISLTLPMEDSWPWSEVFRAGRPGVVEDIRELPFFPWQEHLTSQGVITILIVPMSIAGRVDAVIGVRFIRKRLFSAEELELAQALANQAMLAIQLMRLSARSREAAVVAERNRMARDIHDTLAQGFTGVIVQLEAAEDAMSQGLMKETGQHLEQAGETARESLREARRSVQALRLQALEEKNLCDALEDLMSKMTAGTPLRAQFILQGESRPRPPEWDENILRIGQEVLTNTLRHARATEFQVRLVFDPAQIRLELSDNGRGFDRMRRHDGFGLRGIRERVEAMGGQLTMQSAEGRGTAISITLPFAENFRPVPI